MNFSFYIARHYLFSKKSHHAINIISAISVCGVALATMAMVCTMSVFNGFQDLVASFFTEIDPQLKLIPNEGKTMAADDPRWNEIKKLPEVEVFTRTLEDQALISLGDKQVMVTVKGVEDNFDSLTDIRSILYGDGEFILHADVLEYGVLGIQLASELGVGTAFDDPLQIYAPKKGEKINLANPTTGFTESELYSPGVVFVVKQAKYDASYVITSLKFAQNLFGQEGYISGVELKLKPNASEEYVKKEISRIMGDGYSIMNRYEQQNDVFRIMKVEKLIAFLFLTFILLVACFNIIGSVSMLIIEKKDDVCTLRNIGAGPRQITRIFLYEGSMISGFGALFGIVVGLVLCLLQQHYGFIALGQSSGHFVVDAYPVSVHALDVVLIFFTVIIVSMVAIWYPVKYLSQRFLN